MRLLALALLISLAVVASVTAKQSDFFTLSLTPADDGRAAICGVSRSSSHTTADIPVVAAITLKQHAVSRRPIPFIVAVRRCRQGRFHAVRRVRLAVAPGHRAVRARLRGLAPGEYRIEALLNGDRPPASSAVRHLVVTAPPADTQSRIIAVAYGLFRPQGASSAYRALRVQTQDPDGQVVSLSWTPVSPEQTPAGAGIADGGCGLAARRNGAVGTWYLPMDLTPGTYRFAFELSSSPCGQPGRPETARQTVGFSVG